MNTHGTVGFTGITNLHSLPYSALLTRNLCFLSEFGKNKVELAFLTTICSSGGRFVKENMNAKDLAVTLLQIHFKNANSTVSSIVLVPFLLAYASSLNLSS